MADELKPITRTENFLAKAAGDPDAQDLTPITRTEHFLAKIAEGGGGGGGLPDYSDADEGDVLTVGEDGLEWAAPQGGGEKFIVNLIPDSADFSGNMDKTVAEIYAAYQAGKAIYFRVYESLTDYMDIPVTAVWTTGVQSYPSFNASLVFGEALIYACTGTTDDGTRTDYITEIHRFLDEETYYYPATSGVINVQMIPGAVYNFVPDDEDINTIVIGFGPNAYVNQFMHYHFSFNSGSTPPTLTMPQGVVMPDGFTLEANKRYEVDILDNYGVVTSWALI